MTKTPSPVSPASGTEERITVSDLVSRLTSALATDRNDTRIARSLAAIRLQERLTDPTIDALAKMATGPATLDALHTLARDSAALPAPSEDPISRASAPSASEETALAAAARRWSADYLASLPDFTCTRSVRRFRNYKPPVGGRARHRASPPEDVWYPAGSDSGDASYVAGRDSYRVTEVDGKPFQGSLDQLGRDYSWGEFGGFVQETMDPSRQATLAWDRWEIVRGRRLAVFRYAVDIPHSHYRVVIPLTTKPGAPPQVATITLAHHGFVYVEPQTGAVLRLVLFAAGQSYDFSLFEAANVLDCVEIHLSGSAVVLPLSAASWQRTRGWETREEIEYRDYRKFQSDSTVKFDER